jgi:hypothetical protein
MATSQTFPKQSIGAAAGDEELLNQTSAPPQLLGAKDLALLLEVLNVRMLM